jgi:hypothetical protein
VASRAIALSGMGIPAMVVRVVPMPSRSARRGAAARRRHGRLIRLRDHRVLGAGDVTHLKIELDAL